jgi:bifunctional non-homologous end joining protein LigD
MADARWKPMLASPADEMPADLSEWVLEPKWDGWRTLVVIEPAGVTVIGGRNNNTYNGKVPYIESALAGALPAGTVLDGELVSLSNGWGHVQSTMTGKFAHRPTAADPALTFVAFDVLQVKGNLLTSVGWEHRRDVLEMIDWPEYTYLTPNGQASLEAHLKMLAQGMEGSMLKRRTSAYQGGQRVPTWLKLKAIASEDCEIVGFEPGKNGRSGEVGAIIVRLPSGVETTASGMTDKVRADMLANPQNYLGKLVEIAHNGVMDSGKLRHPRFKRLRDDKSPAPAPKRPSSGSRAPGKRMRNYKAMGDAKLRECVDQFREANARGFSGGEHFVRANNDPNFSAEQHRRACYDAASERGWPVPAF